MNIIFRVALLGFAFIVCTSITFSQSKLRSVDEASANRYFTNPPPIEIIDRVYKRKPFSRDEKFLSESGWLKDLTLTLKNTSRRNIVYIHINYIVPRSELLDVRVAIPLRFGIPNKVDGQNTSGVATDKRRLLRPNDHTTLIVTDQDLRFFTDFLHKRGIYDFERIAVEIHDVEFEGGGGWSLGNYWEGDSNGKPEVTVPNQKPFNQSKNKNLFEWIKTSSPFDRQLISFERREFNQFFFQSAPRSPPPTGCWWYTTPHNERCHNQDDNCGDDTVPGSDPPIQKFCVKPKYFATLNIYSNPPTSGGTQGHLESVPYTCVPFTTSGCVSCEMHSQDEFVPGAGNGCAM